jgi:hypothetical protein
MYGACVINARGWQSLATWGTVDGHSRPEMRVNWVYKMGYKLNVAS